MVSPYKKKRTNTPVYQKKHAQQKDKQGSAKSKATEKSQINEKNFDPYYLRRHDSRLRTVVTPSKVLTEMMMPGQKAIWVSKDNLTNLAGSIHLDT